MTVHFIGAGPGAPDLMTVRGMALLRAAPMVLYAGSLIPEAVIAEANKSARVVDTAPLTLDEIIALIETAHAAGQDVARLHSGDPSLYGAIAEQIRRLDALGIGYDITPGVPAYAAAAAALGCELTLPGIGPASSQPQRRSTGSHSPLAIAACSRCASLWTSSIIDPRPVPATE